MVVSRTFGSEESWNLDALLSALKSQLEARERCTAMKTSGSNANTPRFEQYRARGKQPHSVSALYTGSKEFTNNNNNTYIALIRMRSKRFTSIALQYDLEI